MDLQAAVSAALQSHPAVRHAESNVDQREAENQMLRADRLPTIDYNVAPGYDPQNNRDASMQITLTARQLIHDFGQGRASRAAAANRTDRDRFRLDQSQEEVAAEVAARYFSYAKWREAALASDRQILQLTSIRTRIEQRIAASLADVSDLVRTDVAMERARIERDHNRNQQNLEAESIRILTQSNAAPRSGLDAAEQEFARAFPEVGPDYSPVIAAAREDWQASMQDVRAARSAQLPGISLGLSNSTYYMGSGKGADITNRTRFGLFLTGSFSFGGKMRHQLTATQAAASSAQAEYRNQILQQHMTLAAQDRVITDARARLIGSGRIIATLAQARDLYWQEYILSKRRLTEVFDIEREIYQAEVDRLGAREDHLRAIVLRLAANGQLVLTILGEH